MVAALAGAPAAGGRRPRRPPGPPPPPRKILAGGLQSPPPPPTLPRRAGGGPRPAPPAGAPPPVPAATLAMRDLPKLAEHGYRQLIAPAPPGGWSGFDPVVGVAWASGIARAWAPDARLTRIDLGLIASDGSADLTADRQDTVGY